MAKRIYILLAFCFSCAPAGLAQSHGYTEEPTNVRSAVDKMPVSLEVRYALSALPSVLRDRHANTRCTRRRTSSTPERR
jgi:hypothetical protein